MCLLSDDVMVTCTSLGQSCSTESSPTNIQVVEDQSPSHQALQSRHGPPSKALSTNVVHVVVASSCYGLLLFAKQATNSFAGTSQIRPCTTAVHPLRAAMHIKLRHACDAACLLTLTVILSCLWVVSDGTFQPTMWSTCRSCRHPLPQCEVAVGNPVLEDW